MTGRSGAGAQAQYLNNAFVLAKLHHWQPSGGGCVVKQRVCSCEASPLAVQRSGEQQCNKITQNTSLPVLHHFAYHFFFNKTVFSHTNRATVDHPRGAPQSPQKRCLSVMNGTPQSPQNLAGPAGARRTAAATRSRAGRRDSTAAAAAAIRAIATANRGHSGALLLLLLLYTRCKHGPAGCCGCRCCCGSRARASRPG